MDGRVRWHTFYANHFEGQLQPPTIYKINDIHFYVIWIDMKFNDYYDYFFKKICHNCMYDYVYMYIP